MEILRIPYVRDSLILPIKLIAIVFIVISLIALLKTRKLPKTTKCLNTGLLLFDFIVISCHTSITFLNEKTIIYKLLKNCCFVSINLSHLTVTMMAIDRLIAINWPNKYLQLLFKRKSWKWIISVWIIVFALLHLYYSYLCSSVSEDRDMASDVCRDTYVLLISILLIINVIVPVICYIIVFGIIRNQSMRMRVPTSSFFHHYKSTSVVLLYMVNILVTTILYFIIIVTEMSPRLRMYYASIIHLLNGLADTCSYVLWFKECQLEVLKIMAICFPRLRQYIEPMRIKVYNICTVRNIEARTLSNIQRV